MRINGAKLYIANTEEIKLRRQAKAFVRLQPFGYGALAAYLAGDDAAGAGAVHDTHALGQFPRDAARCGGLLILIGSELRGTDLKRLVEFGLAIPGAKLALLSDYVNSRGAADMGLLPDLLPGYTPWALRRSLSMARQQRRGWTCWRCSTRRRPENWPRCTW